MQSLKYSTEELVSRWEDRRAVKNVMGKFAYSYLIKQEYKIFDSFWSGRDDVCLGTNDGWYLGREAVSGYYAAIDTALKAKRDILKKLFPRMVEGKSDEELYGIGDLEYVALSTPVVELGADGTAKGIWYCHGSCAETDTAGPVAYWTWRCYAVDFVKEGGNWRIWHMLVAEDVKCPAGRDWSGKDTAYPDRPEFEGLREYKLPAPTVPCVLREHYHPDRPFMKLPEPPEPYEKFENTFSYGFGGEEA